MLNEVTGYSTLGRAWRGRGFQDRGVIRRQGADFIKTRRRPYMSLYTFRGRGGLLVKPYETHLDS